MLSLIQVANIRFGRNRTLVGGGTEGVVMVVVVRAYSCVFKSSFTHGMQLTPSWFINSALLTHFMSTTALPSPPLQPACQPASQHYPPPAHTPHQRSSWCQTVQSTIFSLSYFSTVHCLHFSSDNIFSCLGPSF